MSIIDNRRVFRIFFRFFWEFLRFFSLFYPKRAQNTRARMSDFGKLFFGVSRDPLGPDSEEISLLKILPQSFTKIP